MDPLTIFAAITGSIKIFEFFYEIIKGLDEDENMGNNSKKYEARKKIEVEMMKQGVKCTGQEINMLQELTLTKIRRDKNEEIENE